MDAELDRDADPAEYAAAPGAQPQPHAPDAPEQPAFQGEPAHPASAGIVAQLRDWVRDARSLAEATLALAAAETRQTGASLIDMLLLYAALAFLLSCAWLSLVAAGVLALVAAGMAPAWALLLAAGGHVALAACALLLLRRARRRLGWPATLDSLAAAARSVTGSSGETH